MSTDFNYNMVNVLNKSLLDNEGYEKYSQFFEEYQDKPDRYFYREIQRVQSQVSNENKKYHLNNLDNLYNMQGFIDDDIKKRIEYTRSLIEINDSESTTEVDASFFVGSSLLLWFLLATVLFRRGGRRRRGFYRY